MILSADFLQDLTTQVFGQVGSHQEEAECVARHLVTANLCGHDSHGVIRIPRYVEFLQNEQTLINQSITVEQDHGALVVVDGHFGLGQSIGEQAMELGIRRAKTHGVSVVALKNSGHLGRIGDWAEMCAASDMVSVHFVNTSGMGNLVAPWGGLERRLSANPFACGIPTRSDFPLILDISACMIAEGKVRVALHGGKQVPAGCLIDHQGQPTTDPATFYGPPAGSILPIAGHKGYALSMIIEMMAGALTGGSCTNPKNADRLVNGMLSIIIDRSQMQDDEYFFPEVKRYCEYVKTSKLIDENGKIYLPGEMEYDTRQHRSATGIVLAPTTINLIAETCSQLGVDTEWATIE